MGIFVTVFLLVLGMAAAEGKTLELVRGGQAACTIVLEDKPTVNAQFAAQELQHHICLITGCRVPVIRLKENGIRGIPVYVGVRAAAAKAGLHPEKLQGEEYLIQCNEDAVHLLGGDTLRYQKVEPGKVAALPALRAENHGTLWAVYDFLEKACQVHWYAPGDNGITFSPRKTLAVESGLAVRRKPFMHAFRMIYSPNFYRAEGNPYSEYDVRVLKLRWKNTVRYGMGDHNTYGMWVQYYAPAKSPYWRKYFKEYRPEFFSRNYQGKSESHLIALRSNYPDDPNLPPQICTSNPEVMDLMAQEALDRLNGRDVPTNPGRNALPMEGEPYYYPIQQDDNHGYCRCPGCRKLFPDKWIKGQRPDNYIHFYWTSEIARRAAKLKPGLGIVTLAYNTTRAYPKGLDMPPNLSVMMVFAIDRWWHKMTRELGEKDFADWTENEGGKRLLTAWIHLLSPEWPGKYVYKYQETFPGFNRRNVGKWFKKFGEKNLRGAFIESTDEIGMPFWNRQLELYLASKLMDDPSLDAEELADGFFRNYYGRAGKAMKRFYDIVEEGYWNENNYPGDRRSPFNTLGAFHSEAVNWGKAGTAERMAELTRAFEEANRLADSPAVKERLRLFQNSIWNTMLKGRADWEAKEKYRSRPIPEITLQRIPNQKGKLDRIDWTKAAVLKLNRSLDGFPTASRGCFQIAVDQQFVYLRYQEKGKFKIVPRKMWEGDHMEIFIASQAVRPIYQLALGANGEDCRLGHCYMNDIAFSSNWSFGNRLVNRLENDTWTVLAAIPMKDFKTNDKNEFRLNIIRVLANGRKACWSPIFSPVHNTPEKMGKIRWNAVQNRP